MKPRPSKISKCIAKLTSEVGEQAYSRMRALCDLSSAIRWPGNEDQQTLASDILFARYLSVRLGSQPTELAATLVDTVDLARFLRMVTSDEILDLSFTVWDRNESIERRVADIVRFMLTWTGEPDDRRSGPSLRKAHHYLGVYQGFGHDEVSWAPFNDLWQERKPVCALVYVNEYEFGRRLLLDPRESDFPAKLEELANGQSAMRRFFQQARYVQEELRQRLYRDTWRGVKMPKFPDDLAPLKAIVRPPDQDMKRIMKMYGRG